MLSLSVRLVSTTLVVLVCSSWADSANGQELPPSDDDLEVPAASEPAQTPSPTVPAPASSPPPAPPALAASTPPQARAADPDEATGRRTPPAAPAPTPHAAAAPGKRSPDTVPGWAGLRIAGFAQAQYQHNDLSDDQLQQGGAPLNQDEFLVRRARLRFDRVWQFASGSVELDANTANGPRVGIRRAEASLFYGSSNADEAPPLVKLTAGVIDIPFGFELAETARKRWFMERTLGDRALFPTEMDAGAKLSGGISFVRYAVAIMDGEPVDGAGLPHDPNRSKDIIARFGAEGDITPSFAMAGGTSFALGKGFHPGQDAGKANVIWVDFNEDGAPQPTEITGVPGSAATPSENFRRWALDLDLGAALQTRLGRSHLYGEVFVATNYDRGFAPSDPVTTRLDARQAGAHLAFTQELTRYGIIGARFSYYDPNSDIIEVRGGRSLPKTQSVKTLSPLVGLVLPGRARLLFQYDFVRDYLARDAVGVPTDADNDQWTLRLQVEL